MRHKIWMVIGGGVSLLNGYDLIIGWMKKLWLFLGGLLLVLTQWSEIKKEGKKKSNS
jgi:hypothetical protein